MSSPDQIRLTWGKGVVHYKCAELGGMTRRHNVLRKGSQRPVLCRSKAAPSEEDERMCCGLPSPEAECLFHADHYASAHNHLQGSGYGGDHQQSTIGTPGSRRQGRHRAHREHSSPTARRWATATAINVFLACGFCTTTTAASAAVLDTRGDVSVGVCRSNCRS